MNKKEYFNHLEWEQNLVPTTDEDVWKRLHEMYSVENMAESVYGIYSIHRERDQMTVLGAWEKALMTVIAIYDEKLESEHV